MFFPNINEVESLIPIQIAVNFKKFSNLYSDILFASQPDYSGRSFIWCRLLKISL